MNTETRQIHNFREGDLFAERYRLLARAGSGGFADVWRAEDTLTGKVVALKVYTRLDDDDISELAKEYTRMADILHPNLLTGDHFDKVGNIPYLVMHYCSGGSLAGRIGRLSNDELHHIVSDIASGLAYLHGEGIIHQDIKPENILYDRGRERYLLSDFGISSKSRTRMSKSVNMAKVEVSMTQAYAPPEKFSSKPMDRMPDPKGDIFSLGITLYELATGYLPFDQPVSTGDRMLEKQGNVTIYMDDIKDPILRGIIERCLNYHKEDRPSANGIMELLDELQQDVGQYSISPDSTSIRKEKPKTEKINFSKQGNGSAKHVSTHQVFTTDQDPLKVKPGPNPRGKWAFVVVAGIVVLMASVLLARQCDKHGDYAWSDTFPDDAMPNEVFDWANDSPKAPSTQLEKNHPESKSINSSNSSLNRQADIKAAAAQVCNCGDLVNCPKTIVETAYPQYANDAEFLAAVKKEAEECIAAKVKEAALEKIKESALEKVREGSVVFDLK